jgi:alginate O-acetyltransferase complex protein AlgI
MPFISFGFLPFLFIVVIAYFIIRPRSRWVVLLSSSVIFYLLVKPSYIFIILGISILTYFVALFIERHDNKYRKQVFWVSILIIVGNLIFYKYLNFLVSNTVGLLEFFRFKINITYQTFLLPIGISFYTFQALEYLINIYFGNQKPERNFGHLFTFLIYFPKLLAGPIEPSSSFLPQITKSFSFDYVRITEGMKLMAWGFFKKIVIADRISIIVNPVLDSPEKYNSLNILIAIILYTYYLYTDFSGYTDIARGCSKIFGIELMDNFDRPFAAKSVSEFWKRWHISLSSWANSYIYNPVLYSTRRMGRISIILSLFITFFVIGFWHGPKWTFIFFGLIQSVAITIEFLTKNIRKKIFSVIPNSLISVVAITSTFLFFCFSVVFFRADNLSWVRDVFHKILTFRSYDLHAMLLTTPIKAMIICLVLIGFLEFIQYKTRKEGFLRFISGMPKIPRWAFYYFLLLSILCLGSYSHKEFIYFQF